MRQIQPGRPYLPPPAQDKIAPEDADAENLLAKLEAQGDVPLQKALAASVSGLSNPAAKELAYRVLPAGCDRADNLPETAARLAELLRRLPQMADPRVLEDERRTGRTSSHSHIEPRFGSAEAVPDCVAGARTLFRRA